MDELKSAGEKLYAANCARATSPPARPGARLPGAGRIQDRDRPQGRPHRDGDEGKPGTAMASFAHLNDADVAAIVTYERNAWGNKTGDAIQPAEIAAARK